MLSQVYNNVVNFSPDTTYYFGFCIRCDMIMHPPYCSLLVVMGDIALNDSGIQTILFKFFLTKTAGKKAPLIFYWLQFNNVRPFLFCFSKLHRTLTFGIGMTNFPPHCLIKDICSMISFL